MEFSDKFYWFGWNLFNYILFLICVIPHTIYNFIYNFIDCTRILFTLDGSEILTPPWEWEWGHQEEEEGEEE